MPLLRHLLVSFSQLTKCRPSSLPLLLSKTQKILPISQQYQQVKHLSSSAATWSRNESFSEQTPIILDVEAERQKVILEEEVPSEFEGISLERGSTGVIDVEEVLEILRREKGQDIVVLKVPSEFNYADFKVIVTGRSHRHMLVMAELLRRLHKKKIRSLYVPRIEGKNSKTWMAIDFGNIILHIFSPAGRKQYDLEMLWTVGKEFDSNFNAKDHLTFDVSNYKETLASLYPNS